jgi:hypothetical protein
VSRVSHVQVQSQANVGGQLAHARPRKVHYITRSYCLSIHKCLLQTGLMLSLEPSHCPWCAKVALTVRPGPREYSRIRIGTKLCS